MKFAIFIASHINYDNQLKLLERAILSIKNQDYKNEDIDIWLSISFSSIEYENIFNEMNIFNDCFKCFKQDKQMYQLEHLLYLNEQSYNKYKYDWICFLDDDDEYNKERIKAFKTKADNIYNDNNELYNITKVIFEIREMIENDEVVDCIIYWLYTIRPDALNVFFKWFSISSLRNTNADYLLRMYMDILFRINETATIKSGYYLYNTDNDNSITHKYDNDRVIFYATCTHNNEFLTEEYGTSQFKKYIDKTLYNECFKHYHRFKDFDKWKKYLNRAMNE